LTSLVERIGTLKPACGDTLIVGIDGCGGAGKSTLAAQLATLLPGSPVIHTDDFASWDNPLNWWPRLIEQVLEPLHRREPARYQRFDWDRRELAEWHDVTATIVILEGVSATRREFRPYLALSIFVTCPREIRLQRGLARDGEEAVGLWHEWMRQEDLYVADHKPEERADYIVSGFSS